MKPKTGKTVLAIAKSNNHLSVSRADEQIPRRRDGYNLKVSSVECTFLLFFLNRQA
jgi:hypothetical protein